MSSGVCRQAVLSKVVACTSCMRGLVTEGTLIVQPGPIPLWPTAPITAPCFAAMPCGPISESKVYQLYSFKQGNIMRMAANHATRCALCCEAWIPLQLPRLTYTSHTTCYHHTFARAASLDPLHAIHTLPCIHNDEPQCPPRLLFDDACRSAQRAAKVLRPDHGFHEAL